jgi:phospholipid transport system substrate-binding protein
MKKYSIIIFAFLLAACCCRADDKTETQKILSRTIDEGIAILKNKETSDKQKLEAYDKLLTRNCHMELMAMLALGKQGWVSLSAEQRKEFVATFLNVMTRSYYNKLSQVDVSDVSVDYKENIKVSANKRTLKTIIKNSGEGFNVDYKFALRNGTWGVYDLEVEGISLIASYRSQFTDFLKTKSAADLLKELKSGSEKFDTKTVVK